MFTGAPTDVGCDLLGFNRFSNSHPCSGPVIYYLENVSNFPTVEWRRHVYGTKFIPSTDRRDNKQYCFVDRDPR